jgi:WD40 repeat protein
VSGPAAKTGERAKLFLSYGRKDAEELAERIDSDLSLLGFEVWRDRRKTRSGFGWDREIEVGLRSAQLVVALLSPHAVRTAGDMNSPDNTDSVCLDEIAFARFACKLPIVPVLAQACEPPLVIFRLDYIDLCAWRDSNHQYERGFRRLVDAIGSALRGEPPRYRRWDTRLQPFDFASFLFDRRRDFCGREWLFEQIERWRADARRHRALLITGDPGIGKSAIVAQLVHVNPGGHLLAYHCCRADTPQTLRAGRFVRGIAAMIASQLDGYAAQLDDPKVEAALSEGRCDEDPASAFEEAVLNPLHALHVPPGGTRYLLVDALDEALTLRECPTIVHLLSRDRLDRLPGWLKVLATTRKEPDVLDRLRGLGAEEIRADDPRNLSDIERFISHSLGQPSLAERLENHGIAPEAVIRRLRHKSEGNFLWVQQMLRSIGHDDGTLDRLDDLPSGLVGLYRLFFERHFPDEADYNSARRLLEVVVAAYEPLNADQIACAAGLDADYELPRLLGLLAAYLLERDGRYVFYHKSLADWLTAPATFRNPDRNFAVNPRRGHERLADSGWAEYQRNPRGLSTYTLAHLPTHLVEARRWDDLAALLRDWDYLEAKTAAGRVFDLALDFARSVETMPAKHPARRIMRLLEQAIRYDVHFLARHPATLFQCLWNRGWWYDCPESAEHYDPPPEGWPLEGAPWASTEPRLSTLLKDWRRAKEATEPGFTWVRSLRPPLDHLGTAQRAVLRGHRSSVSCVAFALDGRRIASGSYDGTTRLWDAGSGAELAFLRGSSAPVESLAFLPDGRIVTGSEDYAVRVWNADSKTWLVDLQGHSGRVRGVAVSSDGSLIASGATDRTIRVWDAHRLLEVACFQVEGEVWSVAFASDGRRIACGLEDHTARIWDVKAGFQLARFEGHREAVTSITFTPDGGGLVTGSFDRTVRFWDAMTGAERGCLHGHTLSVSSVSVSPDGRRAVSASRDLSIRLWDLENGCELACLQGHRYAILGVAFSPDGQRLVSASGDGTVRIWDASTAVSLARLHSHVGWITTIAFSSDRRSVISGSGDGAVRVWDAATGVCLSVVERADNVPPSTAGCTDSRTRAFDRQGETVFESTESGEAIAWFPGETDPLTPDREGRIWAGRWYNYVAILHVEGNHKAPVPQRSDR